MTKATPSSWTGLYRIGGIVALVVVGFMPIQMAVFVIYPPPTTVSEWFSLFREKWIIALIDMDLLLIVDYVLLMLLYVALWAVLRQANEVDVRKKMRQEFDRQMKEYPKLWEACAKEDPSILSDN